MASGSTSAHSIQRRPGNSKKETSAASAVPSRKVPAPTPTSRKTVASTASGRKPEKRERPPGATMNESGRPMSGPATSNAQRTVPRAKPSRERRCASAGGCPARSDLIASVPPDLVHQVERFLETRARAVHVDRVLLEVAE